MDEARAWYANDDKICDDECRITEYIYRALTSMPGAQDFPGRLERIRQEWRFNTREKVEKGDPTILPDGIYKAKAFTIEKISIQ